MVEAHKIVIYDGNFRQHAIAPDWFNLHYERSEGIDWDASLREQGVRLIDEFGRSGELIKLYRSPNGFYIEYLSVDEIEAFIFINSVADYLRFRSKELLSLVQLVLLSDEEDARKQSK